MSMTTVAYEKLEFLKGERDKLVGVKETAQKNLERLNSIKPKDQKPTHQNELSHAEAWMKSVDHRLADVERSISTIEMGIQRAVKAAKPFMSKNGKALRP